MEGQGKTVHITGVVAEYNPFHNGHKYMLEQARKKGVTHVVAVMSGAAVQRGDVAVFDKHFRAEKAVENGVDLVLELPFPYSCSSGEIFAKSAIQIFAGLGSGVVNSLSFGCECDEIHLLKKAAQASFELKNNELIKQKLSIGKSYPVAVCETAGELYGEDVSAILQTPNNTLAVEYIKSANEMLPKIDFIPVKRKNTQHDSHEISDGFASASAIRRLIENSEGILELCPYSVNSQPVYSLNGMEREILFRLSCANKKSLMNLPDCSGEIADRILYTISQCPESLEEFLQKCKSKNITMARLRRIVMYAVLGAEKSDFFSPPYIRVLALNSRGAEILAKCKNSVLPIDTSLKALENTSEKAARIIRLENNAVSFQQACATGDYLPKNEYRTSVRVIK